MSIKTCKHHGIERATGDLCPWCEDTARMIAKLEPTAPAPLNPNEAKAWWDFQVGVEYQKSFQEHVQAAQRGKERT